MSLENKVVLVTGGSQGIGKAIVESLLNEGCDVIVFDKKKPELDVIFYKVDVSNEPDIEKAFKEIDKLDILINNAGVYFQSFVENTTKEELDSIIDIDFKGTYLVSKHALPLLKETEGNIVNISSGLSITPESESPAYCSAKAAVNMLTKCMAKQYAQEKIRVNAVLPGPVDTPLLRSSFSTNEDLDTYVASNPMKRTGSPKEVAQLVSFLVSDKAEYITGGLYPVDGGESI